MIELFYIIYKFYFILVLEWSFIPNTHLFFLSIYCFFFFLFSLFIPFSKNPIYSIICLNFCFILSCCLLFFLGIDFIAISFLIIYVGAIAVLFLFIVMMLNLKIITINFNFAYYFFYCLFFFFCMFVLFSYYFFDFNFNFFFNFYLIYWNWANFIYSFHNIQILGILLYNFYFFYIIFIAFFLFFTMIFAIFLILEKNDYITKNKLINFWNKIDYIIKIKS